MLVGELRQRLNEKVGQVAASGDQEEIATVMEYVRAAVIALAQQPDDAEFDLQNSVLDTKTAALILRLHPEHVRHLIRQEKLPAAKENGEYRIELASIVDLMTSGRSLSSTMTVPSIKAVEEGMPVVLWERPAEGSG